MQAKDIPAEPILDFIRKLGRPATTFPGFENSVQNSMPPGVNEKLARAKMKALVNRGLVTGCACGCRGDYQLAGAPTDFTRVSFDFDGLRLKATASRLSGTEPGISNLVVIKADSKTLGIGANKTG